MKEKELDYNKLVWEGSIDIVEAVINEMERLNDEAPINEHGDSLLDLEGYYRKMSYREIEEKLRREIDVVNLNKKLNQIIFGRETIKYYAYKE